MRVDLRLNMEKAALITGSSRGIGKGIAQIFAREGFNVAVNYLASEDLAQEVCDQLISRYGVLAVPIQGDVSREEECQRVIDQTTQAFGNLQVLVNNAARYTKNPTESERAANAMLKLNSVEYLSNLALDAGVKSIVNISSLFVANSSQSPFATAYQAGVESLTRHFARQYLGRVKVNAVRPGYTDTSMLRDNFSSEEIEKVLRTVPDGKLIKPTDVGEIVYFLATNPLLTGQIITADKGVTLF